MPLYLRESIRLGPFRVNLSKSGLGFSAGVKGFRIGTGPKGHYIHAGMNGVYYRKTLGGLGRKPNPKTGTGSDLGTEIAKLTADDKLPTYLAEDGVLMRRIISADVDLLISETHADALRSLNEARERPSITLLLCIPVALAFAIALFSGNATAMALLAAGCVAAYAVGRFLDLPRRNVVFAYCLDPAAEKRYKAFLEAIDRIANVRGLWFVKAQGDITSLHAWKKNSGASSLVDTKATAVSYVLPPGVASNITPPMIVIDGKSCYFFPDCLLVMENRRFGAVRYEAMRTAVRDQRMIVDSAPSDAQIVGQTWKYVNKNGSPDRRFNNNRQLPICLFEEIGMVSDQGFKALLQVSKQGVGDAYERAIAEVRRGSAELKDAKPLVIDHQP